MDLQYLSFNLSLHCSLFTLSALKDRCIILSDGTLNKPTQENLGIIIFPSKLNVAIPSGLLTVVFSPPRAISLEEMDDQHFKMISRHMSIKWRATCTLNSNQQRSIIRNMSGRQLHRGEYATVVHTRQSLRYP